MIGIGCGMMSGGAFVPIISLPLNLGSELRPTGIIGETGAATDSTYVTGTGVGRAYRTNNSNQSYVQIPNLPFATYRLRVEVTASTGGASLLIRTSESGGILLATLAVASGTIVDLDVGAADGVLTLLSSANASDVSFTIHSAKQILQKPQVAGGWAHDTWNHVADGNIQRTVSYYQPSTGSGPWPVVIFLHGGGSHGTLSTSAAHGVDFDAVAEANGWLLVVPQGYEGRWSYGLDPLGTNTPDDLSTIVTNNPHLDNAFLDEVRTRVGLAYNIDESKVSLVGVSLGGMEALFYACVTATQILAIATVSATKQTITAAPTTGIPWAEWHGDADLAVPIGGGTGAETAAGITSYRALATCVAEWVAAGNPATLVTVPGGVHGWLSPGYDTNGAIETFLLTGAVPDTVAPIITNFSLTGAAPNPSLALTSDEIGTLYYVWTTSATAVPVATIKTNAIAATPDQAIVLTAGANSGTLLGVPVAVGSHYLHAFEEDAAGNQSAEHVSAAYVVSGSNAWDLSSSAYASKSFSVAAKATIPQDIFVKSDGTVYWIVDDNSNKVFSYSMSTPWDVTTSAFVAEFLVSTQDTAPTAIRFNAAGTKMYILGNQNNDVYEYTLTAWDITTAVFSTSFSLDTQDTTPHGLAFSSDYAEMYMAGNAGDDITQYTLSTPGLVSSATYTRSFSTATQEVSPFGVEFGNSGAMMYVVGQTTGQIHSYSLSTAWNISTATFVESKTISEDTLPSGMCWKSDGLKYFVMGDTNNTVYQYEVA